MIHDLKSHAEATYNLDETGMQPRYSPTNSIALAGLKIVTGITEVSYSYINPFMPKFLKWTFLFTTMDKSNISSRVSVENVKQNGKQCRS